MNLRTLSACIAFAAPALLHAQQNIGSLPEIPLHQLSDRAVSPLGHAALAVRASDWKHSETKNFIYHYFRSFVATPVSVEAEFFYSVIAKDLEKDTAQWERKSHIYIFDTAEDWRQFQQRGSLDPWTGGIHSGGELFLLRPANKKWKGDTLAHEVAHLVVHRFFGNGVPRWLNEGYAEYAASRTYSAFHRARGYRTRPRSSAVDPANYLPLAQLTTAVGYPEDPLEISAFYRESERLVRFLSAADKRGFFVFFEALSKGNRIETALAKGFGGRFPSLERLETEFRVYASKDHGPTSQD